MKTKLAVVMLLALGVSTSAFAAAATAHWTGRSEQVRTATGESAVKCEYDYAGQKLWKVFKLSCPQSVAVE